MSSVWRAGLVDRNGVVQALQDALYDDPVVEWLLPDRRSRRWRLAMIIAAAVDHHHLPCHAAWTTDDRAGAALWSPPHHLYPSPPARAAASLSMVRGLGPRLPTGWQAARSIRRGLPAQDHWHLVAVGTATPRRGEGIGAALLAPILERCDRDLIGASALATTPQGEAFLGDQGFAPAGGVRLGRRGPTVAILYRHPVERSGPTAALDPGLGRPPKA